MTSVRGEGLAPSKWTWVGAGGLVPAFLPRVLALPLSLEAAGNTFVIPPGEPLRPPPAHLPFWVQVWLEVFSYLTPSQPLGSLSASPPWAGTLPCDFRFLSTSLPFGISLRHFPPFIKITSKIRTAVFIIPLVTNAELWKWSKGPLKNRWANKM